MSNRKLAIISTHPIQYNAPLFRLLHLRGNISVRVFYTLEQQSVKFDTEFGKVVEWDVPVLEGYEYQFLGNNGNPGRKFMDVKNPGLEKAVLEYQADAILIFGWNFYSHFRAMRFFKGKIPVFFRGDSNLLNDKPGFKSSCRYSFLRFIYSYCDRFLYVGTNNRAYFLKCGAKANELIYAPHAVDNDRFKITSETVQGESADWRRSRNIGDNDIVFLFAGKFQIQKNAPLLLRAFINLNLADAHLVFVGDGVFRNEILELAGDNPKFHLLPFQNQSRMPFIYNICDVFCLPSQSETWGLSINEAMACGKAILASSRVGGAIDLITPGENGYIFQFDDQADLENKLKLLANRAKAVQMGARSKLKINDFTLDKVASSIERSVEDVTG